MHTDSALSGAKEMKLQSSCMRQRTQAHSCLGFFFDLQIRFRSVSGIKVLFIHLKRIIDVGIVNRERHLPLKHNHIILQDKGRVFLNCKLNTLTLNISQFQIIGTMRLTATID